MRYCTKCVMPETRPGIIFNSEGVCSACQTFENRKKKLTVLNEKKNLIFYVKDIGEYKGLTIMIVL